VRTTDATLLQTPVEGLRATPSSPLPYQADVLLRSFLLERRAGNALVYNSPGLTAAATHIKDLGGGIRLLVNHSTRRCMASPIWACRRSSTSATGTRPSGRCP